ncbi:V-type ATP synthase subunit D [Anaeromyxobacter paludicola]|uniref:V-type ATP synthase subunit D n=1 Tax=Anaeromyxobacter paludicola TaxID=2918171 RepID=A0ABM7X8K4_9BACT|nr:V-type ATP synthase subunit D [Anaeromyxobacter paludicola]
MRARLSIARQGAKLLRGKREVLAAEFFRLMNEVVEARTRLDERLAAAAGALTLARCADGPAWLESLALPARRDVAVAVEEGQVWGVAVPKVTAPPVTRAPETRGTPLGDWSAMAIEAARLHEEALEVLLGFATRELHLKRLGEEIQETSRRINALEQLVLPRLGSEAARIALALEEQGREDVVRLRRGRG